MASDPPKLTTEHKNGSSTVAARDSSETEAPQAFSLELPNVFRRVLITGVAGFIGGHLASYLLAQGHHVIGMDNYLTGHQRNIAALLSHPRFTILRHDIVKPLPLNLNVQHIYHLACPASPKQYQKYPIKTLQICSVGTDNVLRLAEICRARVLIASSSEVYGDPEVHPQPEPYRGNVNTFGHRSCYDEGKRVSEAMAWAYQREYGVDVRIARIFNTYGPLMHEDDGRVVPSFILAAMQKRPVTITGDGSTTRTFLYVTDLVNGLVKLMQSRYSSSPVNFGSTKEYSIREMAHKIPFMVAMKLDRTMINHINYELRPADDPQRRCPDIDLAKQILGWEPKIDLDTGLRRTIEWYQIQLNI